MSKKYLFILLFSWNMGAVMGQNQDALIELHREKLRNLYGSRGLYGKEWPYNGDVTLEDVRDVLKGYHKKVGLIWYLHQNDTLWVTHIRVDRSIQRQGFKVSADSLTYWVNGVNRYFSFRNPTEFAKIRGSELEEEEGQDVRERFNYQFKVLEKVLFPFSDYTDSLSHLVLVPALNLATLPFACFKMNEREMLIDRVSYSIAPSLFEFMAMDYVRNQEREYYRSYSSDEKNALIISNPAYPKHPRWSFPDLPGARKEIQGISKMLDSMSYTYEILSGENATRSNVLADICWYEILYFATHGVSDPNQALDGSFLVLAGKNPDTCFFTARQIQDIRLHCMLKAKLVILSACQTGLGQTHDAGVIGLARAFQIAGADDVLMSLWNVDDRETAVLMQKFFEHYKSKKSYTPYESLRQTQLWYRDHINPDPNYWAAFTFFGIP